MRLKGFILFIIFSGPVFSAQQTWRLTENQQWQEIAKEKGNDFTFAVSQAKQLVSSGKTSKAKKAYADLKKNYPQLAADDFDAFVKAEILYSQRKYEKASQTYDKFEEQFPESEFYSSAIERQYQIATAFLGGQKRTVLGIFKVKAYDDGTEIMTGIADKAGDSPVAQNALKTLAQANEKRGAWHEAYLAWSSISDRWPTGQIGKEALLGMARSLKNDYKGPKFDAKVLESSKSYYAEYLKRYPDDAAAAQVPQTLKWIDEKLAEKELTVGDYYARTGSYTAANIYYQTVIDNWPSDNAAESARQKAAAVDKKQEAEQSKKKKFNWKGLFL